MQKVNRFNFYGAIVLTASLFNFIFFIVFFDYFYKSVFIRGLLEANVWLAKLNHGDFAREYYHIINYMMSNFDISLLSSVNILSTLCIIYAISRFHWLTNLKSTIYFLLAFNLFSVLLVYSAGRTSLTVLALLLCYSGLYPKLNHLKVVSGALFLSILHPETILMVILFSSYSKVIDTINSAIQKKSINLLMKICLHTGVLLTLYLSLHSGMEYFEVTNGAGNILNISFILMILFSVYIFSSFDNFILLFILFFGLIVIMGMNASYVYRVVLFPIILGIYLKQQYIK